jgi:predicted AlkP superfamily pyrophosphatase or phosphodiesterase
VVKRLLLRKELVNMARVCVIDVPGLSQRLLHAIPAESTLAKWIVTQRVLGLTPSWPAVTCSMQATLTTGVPPSKHGIIANGIATFRSPADQRLIDPSSFTEYRRDVSFWEQSNQFVESPRFWQDSSGKSKWKTAMLFFQNSMPGFVEPRKPAADIVLTPKPEHGPDGKISSLCWSQPRELVEELFSELGPFPLMNYWGPLAKIDSSRWIARAAAHVWKSHQPQLQLVYIPHLDYDLQRFGPHSSEATQAVIDLAAVLAPLLDAVTDGGAELVLLSEYAMHSMDRFVQPNRLLRQSGLLVTRDTPDGKLIDYENSAAFAMVDHQIAHVYARDQAAKTQAAAVLKSDLVRVVDRTNVKVTHRRTGDLLLETISNAWFDYRWWDSSGDAPVFAKDVDIHRKPGYDPCELFFDPATRGVAQDPSRVSGSHGIAAESEAVLVGNLAANSRATAIGATEVAGLIAALLEK